MSINLFDYIVVDRRDHFPAIRDQGNRPLCLAFAGSDYNSECNNTISELSVEYLAYHAYKIEGGFSPNDGLMASSVIEALEINGQPLESNYPYAVLVTASPPPPPIFASLYYASSQIGVLTLEAIIHGLDEGYTTILGIDLSESFFSPTFPYVIDNDEQSLGGHAILAVGYARTPENSIYILIRNSWGVNWADGGYAWLSSEYIKERLIVSIGPKQ